MDHCAYGYYADTEGKCQECPAQTVGDFDSQACVCTGKMMRWRNYRCEKEPGPLSAGIVFGAIATIIFVFLLTFNCIENKKYGPRRKSAFGDRKRV